MPQLDGTGPRGQGQRTGRGLGNCQGPNCIYYGLGRGRSMKYRQLQTIQDDKQNLQEIKSQLEAELEAVGKKLEEFDK